MTPDSIPPAVAEKCRKCGGQQVRLRYESIWAAGQAHEWLRCTCMTCEHSWHAPTLDARTPTDSNPLEER